MSESRVLKFGRKKRQIGVVAAGVSVLGGYISGDQWGYVKRQLSIEDGTVPEGVVEAINDDDQHFNILGRHLVSLEKAGYELRNQYNNRSARYYSAQKDATQMISSRK